MNNIEIYVSVCLTLSCLFLLIRIRTRSLEMGFDYSLLADQIPQHEHHVCIWEIYTSHRYDLSFTSIKAARYSQDMLPCFMLYKGSYWIHSSNLSLNNNILLPNILYREIGWACLAVLLEKRCYVIQNDDSTLVGNF